MRAVILGACSLVALGWTATASAAPSARLVYGRGAEADACPDEAALRSAVSTRVGYDPFFPYSPRAVVATIRGGEGGGFPARIELGDDQRATAVRELVSRETSC